MVWASGRFRSVRVKFGNDANMRTVLVIAAVVSIAFGLVAVGRAWYDFRPLTDEERARLRQEGN